MSKIRRKLVSLSKECEIKCERFGWVSNNGTPGFHLLYSSVETYEDGNGLAILGMNPSGSKNYANISKQERPFEGPGYNAYMDDDNGTGLGQSDLQRTVQGIAMVISGASPSEAMNAMSKKQLTPEERMGENVASLLRKAPSGNINPFHSPTYDALPIELKVAGERIGWRMLRLIQPKPHLIVTLANRVSDPPWRTIMKNSGQGQKVDCEKWIHQGMNRKYREVHIEGGPLKGTLLIGLPAVVRDQGRSDVTEPMFEVLAQRLRHHRIC